MAYVDAFVLPVPRDQKAKYTDLATKAAVVFKDCGALEVVECWAEDVPHGKLSVLYRSVQATESETVVVVSWFVWPVPAGARRGQRPLMADPRMEEMMKEVGRREAHVLRRLRADRRLGEAIDRGGATRTATAAVRR